MKERPTASTAMDGLLKGKPTGGLPRVVSKASVDELFKLCRPRYDKKAAMLIVALPTEQILEEAKQAFRIGFKEFLTAGGEKLVIVSKNKAMADVIELQAELTGLTDIEVVATVDAGSRICTAYHDAATKKPPLAR